MDIHVFMDISLQLSMLLWISMLISLDFYGYPCIDLLWIPDPGNLTKFLVKLRATLKSLRGLNMRGGFVSNQSADAGFALLCGIARGFLRLEK